MNSFDSLLEKLLKVGILESGKIVVPNASALSHDPRYKLGVWWYDIANKILLFDKDTIHSGFDLFKGVKKNTPIWIKGRVFQYRGKKYVVVYCYEVEERGIALTGVILADLLQKISDKMGIGFDSVVDEPGHLLYQF